MDTQHPCPVNGCGVMIPCRHLMCADHWRLVPMPIQQAINCYRSEHHKGQLIGALRHAIDIVEGMEARIS